MPEGTPVQMRHGCCETKNRKKKRVLRTESQLFTQDVSSLACFFISLAAYAGSEALQAVLFSSYLVHKTTAVVPGVPSGDRGNWE